MRSPTPRRRAKSWRCTNASPHSATTTRCADLHLPAPGASRDRGRDPRLHARRRPGSRDRRSRQRRRPLAQRRRGRENADDRLALRHRDQRRQVRRPPRHLLADRSSRSNCDKRVRTLPFDFEIVAFAEEEGVRFKSTFLGSSAIAGSFDMRRARQSRWRRHQHAQAMQGTALDGARFDPAAIPDIARDPKKLAGYVEVHIEQGPVLLDAGQRARRRHLDHGQRAHDGDDHGPGRTRRHRADGLASRRGRGRRGNRARGRAALRDRAGPGRHGRQARMCRMARST